MVVGDVHRLRQQVKGGWTRYQAGLIALSVTLLGAGLRLYDIVALPGYNTKTCFASNQAIPWRRSDANDHKTGFNR